MLTKIKNLFCRIFLWKTRLQLIECTARAFRACELIIAVRDCMMLSRVHADWCVKEVLDKYDVESVQDLAKKAQDTAEDALKRWKELNEP